MSAADELLVTERDGGARFRVRVAPRAAREAIAGVHDGALKVSLTAPPVEGAANEALVRLLAKALGVPRREVSVLHGEHARLKTVCVQGVSASAVRAALLGEGARGGAAGDAAHGAAPRERRTGTKP